MKKFIRNAANKLCIVALLAAVGCAKNDHGVPRDDEKEPPVSNSLHIAFETPDWKRHIDCTKLDLYPRPVRTYYPEKGIWDGDVLVPGIAWVGALSASTLNYFMLSYPEKASELENPENLGRYSVAEFGTITEPFQYAMKLPLDERLGASRLRLSSRAGSSKTAFTEITAIERIGTEEQYAIFTIKGRYAFESTLTTYSEQGEKLDAKEVEKPVTGTFKLKVRAYLD